MSRVPDLYNSTTMWRPDYARLFTHTRRERLTPFFFQTGVDDLTEIKPAHVREAHRRMENGGLLFRPRKKTLFRKRGA
jgi:hypothetical protein